MVWFQTPRFDVKAIWFPRSIRGSVAVFVRPLASAVIKINAENV